MAVGVAATVVGHVVPLAGTAVPGAVIGLAVALVLTAKGKAGPAGLRARLAPGLKVASSRLLQCSVVILGAQLSLSEAARVGLSSLPVMLATLAVCLGAAVVYGRLLGVVGDLRTLIGVGTGICGASAIAAVTPVIEASSADVAYAVSTIFLFNIAAVLAFPLLGHALGMSQHAFGLFAGTAVNDTSSVVATATTYGSPAASYAVVVKLVRTLMIIPICVALGLRDRQAEGSRGRRGHAGDPAHGAAARSVVPDRLRRDGGRELGGPDPVDVAWLAQPALALPGSRRPVGDRPVHRRRRAAPRGRQAAATRGHALGHRDGRQPGPAAADRLAALGAEPPNGRGPAPSGDRA